MTRFALVFAGVLLVAAGCGGSSPAMTGTGGGAGAAGAGGTGGSAGAAGASGGAGAAGTTGTAGATGAAGSGGSGGGGGGAGGAPPAAFIVGDIDGVTDRAEMNPVAYKYLGSPTDELRLDANSSTWRWTVVVNNPTVGCGINLVRPGTAFTAYTSALTGGTCSYMVTAPAPNVGDTIEGTFSGTVVVFTGASGTAPITVTNGRFRVPRIADRSPPL